MAKKRRTKQQKIIARLRRQLAQQKPLAEQKKVKISQEVASKKELRPKDKTQVRPLIKIKESKKNKKELAASGDELFFYNPSLIKKDLKKTAVISLVVLAIIGVIKFSHL